MIEGFLGKLPGAEIIQLGFVVADRAQAMAAWSAATGAGPWFTIDNFAGDEPMFRGAPALAGCNIALGYLGEMQIEIVQPCDLHPSVYRSAGGALRAGFHHFGTAAPDFDAAWAQNIERGYRPEFTARVPGGGRVAYFDTNGALPGMIELIETLDDVQAVFAQIKRASVGWAGEPLSISMGPA